MDQHAVVNLLFNEPLLTTNIFVLGEKDVGNTTMINEVQKILKFDLRQISVEKVENDFFYSKIEKNNLIYNFFEIENFLIFEKRVDLIQKCRGNFIVFLYNNLSISVQDRIMKTVQYRKILDFNSEFHIYKRNSGLDLNNLDKNFADFLGVKFNGNEGEKSLLKAILNEEKIKEDQKIKPKPKKIFKIVKVQKPKMFVKKAIRLIKMKTSFTKMGSITDSNKKSKASTKYKEDEEKEDNFNSLIKISKEWTKRNEDLTKVTEYMQNLIGKKNVEITYKNIQRRVYDAINVISAVGLISKRKSNLVYDGVFQIYETKSLEKITELNERIAMMKRNINNLQQMLMALVCKNIMSLKIIEENTTDIKRRTCIEKLHYPFLLIKLGPDACFTIKEDDSNTRVCIFSEKEFSIIKDEEIMKDFLRNDPELSLNIKRRVNNEIYQYMQRHNLLDKYLSNLSNYNTSGITLYQDPMNFGSPKLKENFLAICDSDRNRKLSFSNNYLDVPYKKSFENHDQEEENEVRKFKLASPSKLNMNCFNSNH